MEVAAQALREALTFYDRSQPYDWGKANFWLARALKALAKPKEAAERVENALSVFSDSTDALRLGEELFHEDLFEFDRAFSLNKQRAELGEGQLDFPEKHLTTARYAECVTRAGAFHDAPDQVARIQTVMATLRFACSVGGSDGTKDQAAQQLRADLAKLGDQKIGWTFAGVKHYLSTREPFQARPEWVKLFGAIEASNVAEASAALNALQAAQ